MRRSLDWKRHPLLAVAAVALGGLLAWAAGGAVAAAAVLVLMVLLMQRLGWLRAPRPARTLCVRVPPDFEYERVFAGLFRRCTDEADLVDVQPRGPCTDLQYAVRLKKGETAENLRGGLQGLIEEYRSGSGGT
jgi:hypothetical protein